MPTTTIHYLPTPTDGDSLDYFATVTVGSHTYRLTEEIMWGSQCWEIAHIHRNPQTGLPWFEAKRGNRTAAIEESGVYPYSHSAAARVPGCTPTFPCHCADNNIPVRWSTARSAMLKSTNPASGRPSK